MAPLYRHLAHPVDGILNGAGEGSVKAPTPGPRKINGVTANAASTKSSPLVHFPWDEKLYETLREENEKELETLNKEEEEVKESAGDTEVLAAKGKRAEFWARVGDKVSTRPIPWHPLISLGQSNSIS